MDVEQRNKWIVDNADWFDSRVKSYSDKYGVDFYELYSDCSVELIKLLDRWEDDPTKTAIGTRISGWLSRLCEKALKEKKEEPVGLEFEMIYEPDFNKNIWPYEIDNIGSLTDREKVVIKEKVFEDKTFQEIADIYGVTIARIQSIYYKACIKVYGRLFSRRCYRYLWKFNDLAIVGGEEIRVIGKVLTDHNAMNDAVDEIRSQLASFYRIPKEEIIFRSYDGIKMIKIIEKLKCNL